MDKDIWETMQVILLWCSFLSAFIGAVARWDLYKLFGPLPSANTLDRFAMEPKAMLKDLVIFFRWAASWTGEGLNDEQIRLRRIGFIGYGLAIVLLITGVALDPTNIIY